MMSNILILLIALCILICVLCYYEYNHNYEYKYTNNYTYKEGLINLESYKEYFINDNKHNNKIYMWVYWELINNATKPPDYIKLCFDTMKKNSAKYFRLIILDEKKIFDYLPDLRRDINDLPIALKTDYIRVALLYRYGGMWLDADTIMMNDLNIIVTKLKQGIDYIGFGCTRYICKNLDGYGRPSNYVMGSIKHGRLIGKCLNNLNNKLDKYYKSHKDERKEFDYFDLGKKIVWEEYDNLIKEDPNYKYYHVPISMDGTRDKNGYWVAKNLIFYDNIDLLDIDKNKGNYKEKLMIVMLVNSANCGKDPNYNWFCKLKSDEIMNGKYFISKLFRLALA